PPDWYEPGARPLVELAANRRGRGVSRRPRRPLGPRRAAARRGVPLRTGACGERVETLSGGGEGAGLRRSLLVARRGVPRRRPVHARGARASPRQGGNRVLPRAATTAVCALERRPDVSPWRFAAHSD